MGGVFYFWNDFVPLVKEIGWFPEEFWEHCLCVCLFFSLTF